MIEHSPQILASEIKATTTTRKADTQSASLSDHFHDFVLQAVATLPFNARLGSRKHTLVLLYFRTFQRGGTSIVFDTDLSPSKTARAT